MPNSIRNAGARRFVPSPEKFADKFGVGHRRHIQAVDACGVALSSIQGLCAELEEMDQEIARVRAEIEGLKNEANS